MFTYKSHTEDVNKELRSRTITVVFVDGNKEISQTFRFALDTDNKTIKLAIKKYKDELNLPVVPLSGDVSEVTESAAPASPTRAELDRQQWERDFARLEKVKRLIDCGVLTGQEAAVVTLRNKVKADFKAAYLG